MVSKDPTERALIARIAARTRWANAANRKAATERARIAAMERFEREVDPDGVLDPAERATRAEHAKQLHMLKMTRASLAARRRKGGEQA